MTGSSSTLAERFAAWLDGLGAERLAALAAEYAAGLEADGLTVFKADHQSFAPITPSLSPEPVGAAELAALAADARLLLSGAVAVARWCLEHGPGEQLYAGLSPLEWACLRRDPGRLAQVATARVDYFRGAGAALALELNATIPAMQGYSDVILRRWLRLMAGERGVDPEPLLARAGSNTSDLLASLLEHYQRAGGRARTPSILIVSRRGDSQLGELRHYERAFTAAGHRALHVWIDEVDVDAAGRLGARGERFDLLYRHIFARLVPPESTLGRLLLDPGPNVVLNPVLGPLEVKGTLAVLHEAAAGDHPAAAVLDDEQRAAIARRVPWTRLLAPGPAMGPGGERLADLASWTAAHPERLVVKRSWDYGGKGVYLGPDATGWAELVARAAVEPNTWVVQELVAPVPVRHLLVEAGRPTWRQVFVDVNAYANLGVPTAPRGGVCRASSSKIVNILGGGGLAPLCTEDVLESLLSP